MTAEQIIIGVDGGGSGCRAAVGTVSAGILGQAHSKGAANVSTNFGGAIANITATVQEAATAANLPLEGLLHATAHLGLAGADLAQDQVRSADALPYGTSTVSGDRQTTVAGVLGADDGFVIALGTGTIIARQSGGDMQTVSGWGFDLSDRASGAWLGRSLLSETLDAEEGIRPATDLTRQTAQQLGGPQGIFEYSNTATPGKYATFAPQVFAAARAQDDLAMALLRDGADYLRRGLQALNFRQGDILSLAGGVGPHYEPFLGAPFTDHLRAPLGNALQGAFALATARALHH